MMQRSHPPSSHPSFCSVQEFLSCIAHGAEIIFLWDGLHYTITRNCMGHILIYCEQQLDSVRTYTEENEVLSYPVGDHTLMQIITHAKIETCTIHA